MPTPQPARRTAAKKAAASAKPAARTAAKPAAKKAAPVKRAAPAKATAARTAAKTPAKPAVRKAPAVPSLSEVASKLRVDNFHQPVTVLTAPWEERAVLTVFGAKWNADVRQFLVWGPVRPELSRYVSKPMSWERWIEDEINGRVKPIPSAKVPMKPRPHQAVAVRDIARAASEGWRGYAEADSVGLGKTLAAALGASQVARLRGFTAANPAKVLILCPKSVIQHWRNTLQASGIDNLRVVVINYDQSLKMLTQPAKAQAAKRKRTKNSNTANQGNPIVRWDIVLSDESHKLKGLYTANRSKAFSRIARYGESPDKAPFVIWMSATMGQNPIDLGYMAPLIGQINGKPKMTLDEWGPYLESEGYAVKAQKVGYAWTTAKMNATEGERKHVAQVQRKDVERISAILFGPKAPSIRRLPTDITGWPEQQRVPMAVEFDEEQQRLYQEAWLDFRSQMRLLLRGKNPQGALVAMLRFRQKASLLLVEPGLDHITDLLENGMQVAVSCQFLETIDRLRPLVEKAGYRTAEYSGRINGDEREAERLKFQHGQAKVIFYTVAEAISLHAGEQLADGSVATKAPRANVIIDIRFSGFESLQIEGRTHRDGQNSVTYYMYGESTVQKKLLKSLFQKMKNTSRLSGDTATESLDMVASLIEDAPAAPLSLN